MVIREREEYYVLLACWYIPRCMYVFEAELTAMRDGLQADLDHTTQPLVIQLDRIDCEGLVGERSKQIIPRPSS